MAELLTARGYEVVKAYDGKDGIQAFETNDIRLMFVDLVMPKVDGWQFIRYIRSKYRTTGIPSSPYPASSSSSWIHWIRSGPITTLPRDRCPTQKHCSMHSGPDGKPAFSPTRRLPGFLIWVTSTPAGKPSSLIESLHFQQAITENIGMGILVVDTDTKILNTNSRALEILALTEAAVLTVLYPDSLPPRGPGPIAPEHEGRGPGTGIWIKSTCPCPSTIAGFVW